MIRLFFSAQIHFFFQNFVKISRQNPWKNRNMIIEVNKMTDLSSSRLIFLGHLECQKYKKMTHEEPMRFDENCLHGKSSDHMQRSPSFQTTQFDETFVGRAGLATDHWWNLNAVIRLHLCLNVQMRVRWILFRTYKRKAGERSPSRNLSVSESTTFDKNNLRIM